MHYGDVATYNQLQTSELDLQALLTQLSDLDEQGAQGQAVQTQREALQEDITELIEAIFLLDNDRKVVRNQEASNFVAATPTFAEAPAQQLAVVQTIYGRTVGQGNPGLSSTDINSLLAIAEECPLVGGDAVYKARSLYLLLIDPIYTFADNCSTSQALQTTSDPTEWQVAQDEQVKLLSKAEDNSITTWPNPADGLLTVQPGSDVRQVIVRDGFGRIHYRSDTNAQEHLVIPTSTWASGLYLVTALDPEGRLLDTHKVIILH